MVNVQINKLNVFMYWFSFKDLEVESPLRHWQEPLHFMDKERGLGKLNTWFADGHTGSE